MRAKLKEYYQQASLRGKLSIMSFLLFVCILSGFGLLSYSLMTYLLLTREKQVVEEIVHKVREDVSQIDESLTLSNLSEHLNKNENYDVTLAPSSIPTHHILREQKDISNFLYTSQELYIYGANKNLLFATDSKKLPPAMRYSDIIYTTSYNDIRGYVLTRPIYDKETQSRVIGYVQIFHDLSVYYKLRNRLLVILIGIELISGLVIQIFLYRSSKLFFKPLHILMDSMQEVVDNPSDLSKKVAIKTGDEIENLANIYNVMLEQLSQQHKMQNQFVSDVSHELRTPVAVIKGHLELLQRWGKDDPDILEESLLVSSTEANRMNIMINDMLDMVRIKGSFEQHVGDSCDLVHSVETIVGNFRILHPNFDIGFNPSVRQMFGKIYQGHFEQAVTILVDNAVKYSKDKKEIKISLSRDDACACLTIKDYGEGISEEDLNHIFERFYRSDKSRNRVSTQAGLGIGLAILSQITEAYHCRIKVSSELDKGTEFRLYIPLDS